MTATSLHADAQSSPERRLPFNTSIRTPKGRFLMMSSILVRSLEGRAKQARLRNPRSTKLSMTRDPMKPAAPVTRIRSSGARIKESCVPGFVWLIGNDPFSWLATLRPRVFMCRLHRGLWYQCLDQRAYRGSFLTRASYGLAIATPAGLRPDEAL